MRIQGLNYNISDRISELPQQDCDRLFRGAIEGYGYHKTLEESQLREFNLKYLLIRRGEKLIGIIPFFIVEFSFATIIQGPLQRLILGVQKRIKNFCKIRILFVGAPTTEHICLGISPEENIKEIIRAGLDKISEFAKKERLGTILFYNLREEDSDIAGLLRESGFIKIRNFPNTLITIEEKTLPDYLKRLSRNARKDLRRKIKKTDDLVEIKTETSANIEGLQEQVHQLYMNNFRESDIHFETLTRLFFERISENLPRETKFFLFWENDKLIAFNLCLIRGEYCIDKCIGFDKELAHKYHLYHYSFLHNLQWCIKNGIKYYQMGITDYHPKIRLGAQLTPLYNYLHLTNPLYNLFARFIAPLTSPVLYDPTLKKMKLRNK